MSKLANTGLFFAAVGAIFAGIGAWFLWDDYEFAQSGVATQGKIIQLVSYYDDEGTKMYRPIAEFRDSSGVRHDFSSNVSSSSPGFSRGDTVSIIYDPNDPSEAIIDSFGQRHLLPLIFSGMGSLFIVIGGWLAVSQFLRRHSVKRLRKNGTRVEGIVTSVKQDNSIAVNDEHPWRVVAEARHPRTGMMASYKSDYLWERPYGVRTGDTIPILLSLTDPKESFVDVEAAKVTADESRRSNLQHGFGRKSASSTVNG